MIKGVDYTGITVVPFLHDGGGNYLLGLRSDKCRDERGRWEPAGSGSLDFGETLEEAIKREVNEEVGVVPFNINYLGFREIHRMNDGVITHWLAFIYRAQVNRGDERIMEPDKCLSLKWCKINDLPDPLHSQLSRIVDLYKDQLT